MGNDLGNAWEVPTLFLLEVGLSHQRQLYIVGRIVAKSHSMTYWSYEIAKLTELVA